MIPTGQDSLHTRTSLQVEGKSYAYYSLAKAAEQLGDISRLPFSMKVLLENLLRFEDGKTVTRDDLQAMVDWQKERKIAREIQYRPARVLMQDFTGVPAVVDLAAMRDAMSGLGGDPQKINPLVPVHLVIDHSVMVDEFGNPKAFGKNVELEYQRNGERYAFLKWGAHAFDNFQVVPPGTGICHQVNLEYVAQCVWTGADQTGETVAYPDTLVGTDSHTTMVNGLGVLGWGVGGIEAEAAMLGQPVSMLIPEVVGFRLDGALKEGITATDLVLTVTQMLRAKGVVGRFVEFYGPGLDSMTVADRATIANMAPEYGATCGFFPLDQRTIDYLELTGRDADRIALVKAYAQAQGLWRDASAPEPLFTDTLELDMSSIEPSLAGPKRPQDRVLLSEIDDGFNADLATVYGKHDDARVPIEGADFDFGDGDVAIAAITSCTNTSNPSVLVAAGLVARKAREKGLTSKPWVKTSLAPGKSGRYRLSQRKRLKRRFERARLRPGRLRLHDLYRQFGAALGADFQRDQRKGSRRGQRALRQPQFRRPGVPRLPRQLSRVAAAGRRIRAQGHGPLRHDPRADRHGPQRRAGVPQGHLAVQRRDPRLGGRPRPFRHVPQTLCRRLSRGRPVARDRGDRRCDLRVAARVHLHPKPALLHRHDHDPDSAGRHRRCPGPGRVRRFRSPPTTSPPRARSSPTAPPAVTCSSTVSAARSSTAMAPAAATTK